MAFRAFLLAPTAIVSTTTTSSILHPAPWHHTSGKHTPPPPPTLNLRAAHSPFGPKTYPVCVVVASSPLAPGAHNVTPNPPGQELLPLHALYGGQRRVVGLDLSQGMIRLARAAIASASGAAAANTGSSSGAVGCGTPQQQQQQQQQPVEAVVADASALDAFGPAAAVVSVFGLQQMSAMAPAVGGRSVAGVARGACGNRRKEWRKGQKLRLLIEAMVFPTGHGPRLDPLSTAAAVPCL